MTPLHKQARALAEAGFKVFPCKENAKEPATPNGFKDASDDLKQIDAWWTENGNYNIAFEPDTAGLGVIDLDPGGAEVWAGLIETHGQHAATYEVETPRGGKHLYFKGSIPSSAGRLGVHVDTRGSGGYVLVPPSRVNGKLYRVLHDRDIADFPEWVTRGLVLRDHQARIGGDKELDTPIALDKGQRILVDLVKRGAVARNDGKANSLTYIVAAKLRDTGVSRDAALRLLLEHWNPHCVDVARGGAPYPWAEDELGVIVTNAFKYAQNEAGVWAATVGADEAWGDNPELREALKDAPKRSRFHPMDEEEMENLPLPKWLIKDVFQSSGTAIMYAGSGSYKSFIALDLALGIATGEPVFGDTPEPGLVFYGALEGLRNIAGQRRRAWKNFRKLTRRIENFFLMPAPMLRSMGEIEEFAKQISIKAKALGKPVRLIVLDTIVKCMAGLDDSSSKDTGEFVRFCDALVEKFNCVVLAIHHVGKDTERGPKGSYNLIGGFDTILEIKKVGKLAIEVWVRKQKDAEERAYPWTFQGHVIQLSTDPDDKSLAFEPTTAEEHNAAVDDANPYHVRKVASALGERGARGREKGLATSDLVVALLGRAGVGNDHAITTLEKLARTTLRAYAEKDDGYLKWFLPEKTDEQHS